MKSRTLLAVEQQINAMGCEVYEIGLFKPHVPGSDSKEPEMLPRTWDSVTLLKSVPWLRYPFVRVIEARPAHVYAAAGDFVNSVREVACALENHTRTAASSRSDGRLLSIDDFRSNPSYDGDGNRIDLAYSVYALAHGVTEAAIAEAINSRDLSKKGAPNRQSAYTSRTIAKAAQRIQGQNGR